MSFPRPVLTKLYYFRQLPFISVINWIIIISHGTLFIEGINSLSAYLENSLKCLYWCRSTLAEGLKSFTCNKIEYFETLATNCKMFSYDIWTFWNIDKFFTWYSASPYGLWGFVFLPYSQWRGHWCSGLEPVLVLQVLKSFKIHPSLGRRLRVEMKRFRKGANPCWIE